MQFWMHFHFQMNYERHFQIQMQIKVEIKMQMKIPMQKENPFCVHSFKAVNFKNQMGPEVCHIR